MNEIMESLYQRKSMRAYEDREIPEEMKKLILKAASQAPTAGCQQLYTILDITDQKLKEALSESCEEQRRLLCLPDYVFPAAMLVFGWPTEQQKQRPKPERCEQKHIVHENTYRDMDGEELREMFAYKCKNRTYEEWCNAFCNRKYNSDFSKETEHDSEQSIACYDITSTGRYERQECHR